MIPEYFDPTPLQEITWPEAGDNKIYIRRDDLLPYSFGGNKVRIGSAFIRDMKAKGCNALIMYGDLRSNLCRVVSNLCSDLQIPSIMIATAEDPDGTTPYNEQIIRRFGPEILVCEKDQIAETVDRAFELLRSRGYEPYYIYGDRTGRGNEGTAASAYFPIYREILDQADRMGISPDYIFTPYGTGSTHGGLTAGCIEAYAKAASASVAVSTEATAATAITGSGTAATQTAALPEVIGISISSRGFERASELLREGISSCFEINGLTLPSDWEQHIHLETKYNCGGYGQPSDEVSETIEKMLLLNGIPMDQTYTGKAFTGMIHYLKEHDIHGKSILFLHTGGLPLFFDYLSKGDHK